MIGLLDYCVDSKVELAHPGIVVLDSPLVTYKRRDNTPGEEIPEDVTAAFYEALAKLPTGRQVIVLENNDPPTASTANLTIRTSPGPQLGDTVFTPLHSRISSRVARAMNET